MKNLAAKASLAIAIAWGAGFGQLAQAGVPVIDYMNLPQNVTSAIEAVAQTLKQIEQYGTQIQQYQAQLQQYENQIQNTVAPAAYIWDQANGTINKLVQAQDMLNYYRNRAGSLNDYLAKYQNSSTYRGSPCYNGSGCTDTDHDAMIEQRQMTSDAQKHANDAMFRGLEQQQDNMQADARQLERLQAAASTADGQVKAIQYANQLASAQGNQLLQIRGLMIAQQNALAAKQAADQDRAARNDAMLDQMTDGKYQDFTPKQF